MKSRKSPPPVNILTQLSMNNPRSRQSKNGLLQSATTSVRGSTKITGGKSTAEKVYNLTNNIQGKSSVKGSNLGLNSARIRPHEMQKGRLQNNLTPKSGNTNAQRIAEQIYNRNRSPVSNNRSDKSFSNLNRSATRSQLTKVSGAEEVNQKAHMLGNQVQDVLVTARTKITELDGDIENLQEENRVVLQQIDETTCRKKELQDSNKTMQEELKSIKKFNGELSKEKAHLQYQLRKMKDEMQTMIDKANKRKDAMVREIENLRAQQMQVAQNKQREHDNYEK